MSVSGFEISYDFVFLTSIVTFIKSLKMSMKELYEEFKIDLD